MTENFSDDDLSDLPDLAALFPPKPLMATGTNIGLRRSPRKKTASQPLSPLKIDAALVQGPKKRDNAKRQGPTIGAPKRLVGSRTTNASLETVPLLPRSSTTTEMQRTSNNRRSPFAAQRSLKLAHVDSISLSLKAVSMEEEDTEPPVASPAKKEERSKRADRTNEPQRQDAQVRSRKPSQTIIQAKQKQIPYYTSRFVLKEAHCNDDEGNSNDEEEDEDTDLSGFIVGDDAEISFYNDSVLGSDDESGSPGKPGKRTQRSAPWRRLQRVSPARRQLSFGTDGDGEGDSDKENLAADMLSKALRDVSLGDKKSGTTRGEIEVIDLTSSPTTSPPPNCNILPSLLSLQAPDENPVKEPSHKSNLFKNFDATLKFSPPSSTPALMVPSKDLPADQAMNSVDDKQQGLPSDEAETHFKTPPATPPRSPSKLKSPSKLLSPSKRQAIPNSPHRQSMDAFWDHNVINEWNDEYSPKKELAASPRKNKLARFQMWSDSDDEDEAEENSLGSSDSLPSPCFSPSKSKSPIRSPEKEEKKRRAEEKRLATAAKRSFDSAKVQLALDLFQELDKKVAKGQLANLSSSTGGVKIIWSKTLRSTAGRANWKRTMTKLSGSPMKGNPSSSDPSVKVQHYASIELAEKIIDCEDRLVNTLAHEFCHLTNFMISNVRDQPHGASFKEWATKVTSHLRTADVASWRKVEVTTKHSYVINHKYLWLCTGRPRSSAMEFLNVDDEGCGAEYGRHSKSIDVEKHRCGKCKGLLVQVRPKPRSAASPKKMGMRKGVSRGGSVESEGSSASGSSSQTNPLRTMLEVVELSD